LQVSSSGFFTASPSSNCLEASDEACESFAGAEFIVFESCAAIANQQLGLHWEIFLGEIISQVTRAVYPAPCASRFSFLPKILHREVCCAEQPPDSYQRLLDRSRSPGGLPSIQVTRIDLLAIAVRMTRSSSGSHDERDFAFAKDLYSLASDVLTVRLTLI